MGNLKDIFKENTRFKVFLSSILIMSLGLGLYKGVLDNYLAEIVEMTQFNRGVTEFFRELPGLALVFILAVLYMLSAEAIYKVGAFVMLIGMGMQAIIPANTALVIIAIAIYSLGEHMQLGMKNTISMGYSKPGKEGAALGAQSAVSQVGMLLGYVVIIIAFMFVTGSVKSYKAVFFATAIVTGIGAILSLSLTSKSETDKDKNRFYFHKKYTKYYFLEVFYGARKQVFLTFGPYVLVLFYGANARTISLLFAISAICCFIASPFVGKLIDKVGYKIIMVSDTIILIFVCLCYGFAHHIFSMKTAFIVCCVNYVLDAVISLASMATSVYVKDLSDNQSEVKATLSTGVSVNHLITILIALFGGWIWQTLGIESLFILSAVMGVFNSIYAATIKTNKKKA